MSKSFPEWWKHGQKVRTANDGVLTLNIAEDSEYWLTNNAGKEVSVFSMDILGPAAVPEGCSMTTDITELAQSLKAAAGKATKGQWVAFTDTASRTFSVHTPDDNRCGDVIKWAGFDGQRKAKANAEFIALANPANVKLLVEALEKAQQQIIALQQRYEVDPRTHEIIDLKERITELESEVEKWKQEAEAWEQVAEKQLATAIELESRTVKLPDLRQIVSGDRYVWSDGVYNYSQDVKVALAAAGIKVEAE